MKNSPKILLVSSDLGHSAVLEGTLLVAKYDLTVRHDLEEAIRLALLLKDTPRRFDLMVMEPANDNDDRLKLFMKEEAVNAILYVDCHTGSLEPYCIQGNLGCLYQDSALLAAVKELLSATKNNGSHKVGVESPHLVCARHFEKFIS